MAFTPDPYLFSNAAMGGVRTGSALADLFQQRKKQQQLSQLSELFGRGDYEQAGALAVGMGEIGAGADLAQIPYKREQQRLQQDFQNAQFMDNRDFRQSESEWRRLQAERDDEWRRKMFQYKQERDALDVVPSGYVPIDPSNPSAGVEPLPGIPSPSQKPLSPLGKIRADYEAGLIDKATMDAAVKKITHSNDGITIRPDGTVQIGGKAATEGQSKANIYATRMERSNQLLNRLETEGTSLSQALASGVPLAGNYLLTPGYRQYDQAKRDFVNATLRQESGAVISPAEFANAEKQYFPQPGDDPQTIKQKRQNRIIAMKSIREASGPFQVKSETVNTGEPINVPSPMTAGKTAQDAITVTTIEEAERLPSGTWVSINGRIGQVE